MLPSILKISPLGNVWQTIDPFLICVHHYDNFPPGDRNFGPISNTDDRAGSGSHSKGWSMYHGKNVPGFPAHPHRGFETITIVRTGTVDHSDSLGNSARYGNGDVQWLTAGRGIVHAEVFPLLNSDKPNPLDLIQIWLNLPSKNKLVDPNFKIFWAGDIPKYIFGEGKRNTEIHCIAGNLPDVPITDLRTPPPYSWAADPSNDVAIWVLRMEPGATWTLPKSQRDSVRRQLYFFAGESLSIDGQVLTRHSVIEIRSDVVVQLTNGALFSEILLLQGRPIGEPIVKHGPFVMNSAEEINQALDDFKHSLFGTWEWKNEEPVHGSSSEKFVSLSD